MTFNNINTHCKLREIITKKILELSTHQYGNYLIQFLLNYSDIELQELIVECIKNNLIFMTKHKYASYVVEKSIREADDVFIYIILDS